MGLAPILVKQIFSIIEEINKTGTTILLVEQNANLALSIANRAYVVETGRIVLSGTAKNSMQVKKLKTPILVGNNKKIADERFFCWSKVTVTF